MVELLDVIESVRSDNDRVLALFNREDGRAVKSMARPSDPRYKHKLAEAAKFLGEIVTGQRPVWWLREVMTTDDFPILFGDILDRSVLAAYQEWPNTWEGIAKRATVADFRDAKIYPPLYGADGVLEVVPEATEYPDARVYEQEPILWHVTKYGRTVPFSWESQINDDLDMLRDIPTRLGRAARRTESSLITALYVTTTGPHGSMYHADYGNIINTTNGAATNNPPLSVNGLQDAYTVLSKMTDESGQPIMRDMLTLVVPPALEVTARNILNATELHTTQLRQGGNPDASSSGYNELSVSNWMRNRLRLVVDPYIPMTATTNGNTTWFLFANPNSSREAMRIGFLRGHETPEMWMKSPNAVRIGGGAASPFDGDFDTDSITYKVRHVTGVSRIDPKATVASNGSGS